MQALYERKCMRRGACKQGSGPGWSLQVIDMANLTTSASHQYCVNGTGGPISVTLVWHDYPAALSAATTLVNDLDLTVRAAGLNGFPLYVGLLAPPAWSCSYVDRHKIYSS